MNENVKPYLSAYSWKPLARVFNLGHQAIQKATYNFLKTNGWLRLKLGGQAAFNTIENGFNGYVNETLWNRVKILSKIKVK